MPESFRQHWRVVATGLAVLALLSLAIAALRFGALNRARAAAPAPKSNPPVATVITFNGTVQATKIVNVAAPLAGVVERVGAGAGEAVFQGELLATIRDPKVLANAEAAEADLSKERSHVSDLESALIEARLEASRSRADATRAQAELDLAQKSYDRQKLLYTEGATARTTWEKTEANYNRLKEQKEKLEQSAKAAEDRIPSLTRDLEISRAAVQQKTEAMDTAKAEIGMGEVRSPVDGIVLSRHARAG
ncbi:MAG: hypothetical protein JO022_03220, partial [Acidobacteriaceae bacterium]|nr:hypothetical protein [Acidobacteriaceae bacterium]